MGTTESSSPNKHAVYDPVRRIFVPATEEEKVRQRLIDKMVSELGYPAGLISVERRLSDLCRGRSSEKIPNRRVDLVCFAKKARDPGVYPLLVVECKESKAAEKEAIAQVLGYNALLGAPFIAVAHPEGETLGYKTVQGFSYLPFLPGYQDLVSAIEHG